MILTMESLILMEFEDGKFKCDDSDDGKINSSVTPRNYHINFPTVSIGTMGQPSSPYRQIPFPYGRQKCPWAAVLPDLLQNSISLWPADMSMGNCASRSTAQFPFLMAGRNVHGQPCFQISRLIARFHFLMAGRNVHGQPCFHCSISK